MPRNPIAWRSRAPREPDGLRFLRDRLKDGILSQLDGVHINGSIEQRLPNNLNLSFAGVEAESFLMALEDVALSSGSACNSTTDSRSYVFQALGSPEELALASVRFGLGRLNTPKEVDLVVGRVVERVKGLRDISPLPEDPASEFAEAMPDRCTTPYAFVNRSGNPTSHR